MPIAVIVSGLVQAVSYKELFVQMTPTLHAWCCLIPCTWSLCMPLMLGFGRAPKHKQAHTCLFSCVSDMSARFNRQTSIRHMDTLDTHTHFLNDPPILTCPIKSHACSVRRPRRHIAAAMQLLTSFCPRACNAWSWSGLTPAMTHGLCSKHRVSRRFKHRLYTGNRRCKHRL